MSLTQILSAAESPVPIILEDFNRPFLFSYLSWQDKVRRTNGVTVLQGVNNQGGAGIIGDWARGKTVDLEVDAVLLSAPSDEILAAGPPCPTPTHGSTHEAYWDLCGWPMLEEFTVDLWGAEPARLGLPGRAKLADGSGKEEELAFIPGFTPNIACL